MGFVVGDVRAELARRGDPVRAVRQQAYMKSSMPYAGLTMPDLRRTMRTLLRGWEPSRGAWEAAVLELWRDATVREERYAATFVSGAVPAFAADPASMPLYEEMIVTGAWWDHVDEVATKLVGPLLPGVAGQMRAWATDADVWKRRTAIICQVGRGGALDRPLLVDAIVPNVGDGSFWIRKAIGWALRQHARVDPVWVTGFVDAHPDLSGLSRREALRHLGG